VALFPFDGDAKAVNSWFERAVLTNIEEIGDVPVQRQGGNSGETGYLAPDEPPPLLLAGERYAMTGATYPDLGEYHLQLWLWDLEEPALIYTDELVSEEVTDSSEFVALLVQWLFSHL
jgi:hypothetical protein